MSDPSVCVLVEDLEDLDASKLNCVFIDSELEVNAEGLLLHTDYH